ncbi:energy transducer TonB [Burkholderia stabilis]|uniref:energy transducer TonB n=1 Tax=Burkholderia stabilis TaxID=95485 RepID=UPI00159110EA|nr:energy transducer TonB [Burkholderia stabilis]
MSDSTATAAKWLERPRQYGANRQGTARRYAGIVVVLLLHVVFVYALLNGLASKVVQAIQNPVEVHILKPVKPPPPPPIPIVKLAPPTPAAPPKRVAPYVPKPEVPVVAQPVRTIEHQAEQPAPVAPPAPPAPIAPPAAAVAKPVSHEAGVVCPNSDKVRAAMVYPEEAQNNNITGDVLISFVVDPQGRVTEEKVERSADPLLDRAAFNAVKKFNCVSQGQPVRVQVPFSFNLN